MNRYLITVTALALVLLYGCTGRQENERIASTEIFEIENLDRHLSHLASDEFLGRFPGTEGEERTVDYLISECKKIGLLPGNGNSYIQEVPLMKIKSSVNGSMEIKNRFSRLELPGRDEFVIWSPVADTLISLDEVELIFAGYGIVAPEYGWNDYENIDVEGKAVVVLINDPGFISEDPGHFKGKEMTYYGRWTYKFEEAARQGAKACFIIHQTAPASYAFSVVQNSWNGSKLYLDDNSALKRSPVVAGWVTEEAAERIFEAAGLDFEDMTKTASQNPVSRSLDLTVSAEIRTTAEFYKSKNVIAAIKGKKLSDEYIIYTAHWDHLGVGAPDRNNDSIYNGALDNATGVAALLELARVFSLDTYRTDRSKIFLFVTAEEQGLLGSSYYAQNPVYPVNKTVANINIDGISPFGKTRNMTLSGKGQTTIEEVLAGILLSLNRELSPDPNPSSGGYFRSDHFNFAKIGVPAIYAGSGRDYYDESEEAKAFREELSKDRYHRPSDEYFADKWNWEGFLDDLLAFYLTGKNIANTQKWPEWKEGSEFKAVREKSLLN